MSLTKSAHQVLKKEIEKQKNLFFWVKFELIPRILNVGGNFALGILLRTYTWKLRFYPVASA